MSQLEITNDIYQHISMDIQEALQKAEYTAEVKLNTNEAKTWVERDIVPQIQQIWLAVFSHLSDSSAKKCIWYMSLQAQTQIRRSRMSLSPSKSTTPLQSLPTSTVPVASPSISTDTVFGELMIALLMDPEKATSAMKIRVQDLCPDSDNSTLNNVSYYLLAEIAAEDLGFEQDSQEIVFIDADDIPYVVQNDRNLKAALQSVLQSSQQHQQAGKLYIQQRSGR